MKKRWIVLALVVCVIAGVLIFRSDQVRLVEPVEHDEVLAAYELLISSLPDEVTYVDYLNYAVEDDGVGVYEALPEGAKEYITLDYRQSAKYIVTVERAGWYFLELEYMPEGNTLSDFTAALRVNGAQDYTEMNNIALPLIWRDETKQYPLDSYGDQSAPRQLRSDGWRLRYVLNNIRTTSAPLKVKLNAGANEIEFTNVSSDGLALRRLIVSPPDIGTPSYAEYINGHAGEARASAFIPINAIDYIEKSASSAIYESINDPSLTPHDSVNKKLNVLTYTATGTELTYSFEAPESGYYQIALHYQNQKAEFCAFQTILIDDAIPFKECECYAFPVTSGFENVVLSDAAGTPYLFYLTQGAHTLTLRLELEPVIRAWRYARLMAAHVTRFSLKITELTGSQKDKNRTWKMTRYIPEIADYLSAYETLINYIKTLTQQYSEKGADGAMFAELNKALEFVEDMARYPDEIALYTDWLTGRDASIIVSLSKFTSQLVQDNLSLDMVYVYGEGDLPRESANAFESVANFTKTLASTFTSDKYKTNIQDGETLTVWVNRALTHVDLLQKLADTEFTPQSGIKVKFSAITDPGKLTLSAAAGNTPDMALGLASHMPFDLASRGALYDMTQFEDFWRVASQSPAGAFVPYVFNEGVYAIPETLDFSCLVYRRDIFDSLGLSVPDTWQDVIELLPELQRYGMNFYHNISAGVGYKWFYQTTPLIFQHNGQLYTPDGYKTAIDQPPAIQGIQALGNLFIAYSLDKQVNSFFDSFRYAVLPVGILDSASYVLIKNGAPELDGQWALAPYPGTVQPNGDILRWYVANGQGGVIFKDTQKPDEAWTFLKWWLSHDVQSSYSNILRSTYGDAFLWLPANYEALKDAPIDRADKDVILECVKWLRDVPRTPGQYILERSISDIWNSMINEGTSAQVTVDEKVILINREIRKKMAELGYYDQQGNAIEPYVIRDIDWIQRMFDERGVGDE